MSIFDGKGGAFLLDFLVCVAIKGCNGFLYPGFSEYLCTQNVKKECFGRKIAIIEIFNKRGLKPNGMIIY